MPNSLENQFIADTFKALLHTGNVSLSSGSPDAAIYSGDGFESSLTVSTVSNGIKVSGKATISGDVLASGNGSFSGSLSSGSHILNGDSNINGSVDIGGGINIGGSLASGSHTVTGNSIISGTAASGSHTVTGNSIISGTARVGGTATIIGSLSSGSHTVTGNSRITNRIDTDVIYANTYLNLPETDTRADIVNHIYPVGSIFLSFTNTNPGSRFTGTTWVQVSQGRFVVGVGTGNDGIQNRAFAAGNTNGEYQHQLTIAEMPSHRHSIYSAGGDAPDSGAGAGFGIAHDFDSPTIPSGGPVLLTNALSPVGNNQYHENTPPGFGLYVWQRTS